MRDVSVVIKGAGEMAGIAHRLFCKIPRSP